jgi:hypothetical protein
MATATMVSPYSHIQHENKLLQHNICYNGNTYDL